MFRSARCWSHWSLTSPEVRERSGKTSTGTFSWRLTSFTRHLSTGTISSLLAVSCLSHCDHDTLHWKITFIAYVLKSQLLCEANYQLITFFFYREFAGMLWPLPALVPRVLPWNDDGQAHPVPNRDVHAVDSHRSHLDNQRLVVHGVSHLRLQKLFFISYTK